MIDTNTKTISPKQKINMLSTRQQSLFLAVIAVFSIAQSACFSKKKSVIIQDETDVDEVEPIELKISDVKQIGGQATDGPIVKSNPIFKNADWVNNAVIYEVNVRQYTQEGTFKAFQKHIPRLQNLGVDILWFMPLQPIGKKNRKGDLGSYYSISNYTGINPEFGDINDFKAVVDQAHKAGMKVILDWVGNHTAWDHPWITEHPDWYQHDDSGKIKTPWDWTDVAQLNYKNPELRKEMIKQMQYWLDLGLDGFRCDVCFLVPVDFWEEARIALENKAGKKLFMLAEMEWNPDIDPNPARYMNQAFDAYYAWNYHGKSAELAKGKITAADFIKSIDEMRSKFPKGSLAMHFITNHDENTWNGTVEEKYGEKWKLFSMLNYTLSSSIPLIYSGEEANNKKRLEFFKKDPIPSWSDTSRYAWYRSMNALKHTHPALLNVDGIPMEIISSPTAVAEGMSSGVFIFKKTYQQKSVLVMCNLSDEPAPIALNQSGWSKGITSQQILIGDRFQTTSVKDTLSVSEPDIQSNIHLQPWGFVIIGQ